MADKARTPWFDSGVKPARRGVYERDIGTIGIRWSYWNGKFWGGFANIFSHAVQNRYSETGHPDARWRGLSRKPR